MAHTRFTTFFKITEFRTECLNSYSEFQEAECNDLAWYQARDLKLVPFLVG